LRLERSTFINCRAPNGAGGAILIEFDDELAKEVMGGEWRSVAAADGETMGLLQCRFDRCSAGTEGGAVAMGVGIWTSSFSTLIEDTAFEQSQLRSEGTVEGGSLCVKFTAVVQDVTNTVRRTNFTDGVLESSNRINGGGGYWGYLDAATNVNTLITKSIFTNMSLISQGGWCTGGGIIVQMLGEAIGTNTTIEDSTFSSNNLWSTCFVAIRGGSVYLYHGSNGPASSVVVVVRRSSMQYNSLTIEGDGQPGGGGLCFQIPAEATGMSLAVEDSIIGGHTLQSARGDTYGASLYISFGASAASVAVVVRRSFMQGNSLTPVGGSVGGGLYEEAGFACLYLGMQTM
jgi:hypothetical protein